MTVPEEESWVRNMRLSEENSLTVPVLHRLKMLILIGEDGRIEYAGKHEDVPAEAGYNSIDAAGKTVMPGLIDTHLHFSGNLTDDDTD